MKFSKSLPAALLLISSVSLPAAVTTVYDSSFTSTEGYADGGIPFGVPNPDTIVGQGAFSVSDSAGLGTLNGATGFQRALFGWDGTDGFTVALVNSLTVGSTISVQALGLTIPAVANPSGNNNVLVLGLSNVNDGNILGGSGMAGGGRIQVNSSGDIYVNTTSTFNPSLGVGADTGINVGATFDLEVLYTAEGGGLFTIEHKVGGTTLLTEVNRTFNFGNGSAETAGHIQDQGGAVASPNNYTVDRLVLNYNAIPEPSVGLFSLSFLGLLLHRRR